MESMLLYNLIVVKEIRDPCVGEKWYVLGGFSYHGNLLAILGFLFLMCRVSNFIYWYSRSGLKCPNTILVVQALSLWWVVVGAVMQ